MQRVKEWLELSPADIDYHERQWRNPYRSTEAFAEFITPQVKPGGLVIDLACGGGAATYTTSSRFPETSFLGVDISAELVRIAQKNLSHQGAANLSFEVGDWFNLNARRNVDGVFSLHTLFALPDWRAATDAIVDRLAPKWIAFSSLFYEGDISCRIEVTEHKRGREVFYNVCALPEMSRWAAVNGYKIARFEKFNIDIDLPRSSDIDVMGTYTERVQKDDGGMRRLQISGPVLMNWAFVMLIKVDMR